MKTLSDKLNIIVNDLRKYDPEKIILFGSAARGDVDEHSDIDIVVVKETDKSFVKRLRDVALLCRLDEPIDILVYTPAEIEKMNNSSFFIKNILADGKVIYERRN